jgi:tetratricopeptide (TPR) repeat protein
MTNHCISRAVRLTVLALTFAGMVPAVVLTTGCFSDERRVIETQRTEAFDLFSQGEELERRGDLKRAIDYYARAAEISPRPAFFARAGRAHATLGEHAKAIHYFDLALGLNPDYEVASAQRELSVLALKREEAEGAAPLELANALQPPTVADTPAAPPAPAVPETAAVFEPVTPAAPAAPAPAAPVAPAAPEAPVAEDVVVVIEPSVPVAAPAVAAAPATELVVAPVAGLDEEALAVDLSMDALVVNPGDLPPRRIRAAGEGIDREAIRQALFAHALELDAEELEVERWAAQAATDAQRWDEATRRWERVLSEQPEDVEALVRLGDALQRSGRQARAWDIYRRAGALAPEDSSVFRAWGNSLVRANELDLAAEQYAVAVKLAPEMAEVRNNLAAIDIQRGQGERALADLRNLLEEQPNFAPGWLNLAIALQSTGGDTASQISALETYLKLDGSRDAEAERWILELRASGR